MARIKLKIPEIKSRAEMEALVGEICALKINESKLKADMDDEIKAVREDYESDLSDTADRLNVRMQAAQAWAENHPAEFGKLKSIEMTHGVVGWRIGQPQLKTLAGWTWDRVLERLQQVKAYAGFIRTKLEVDKQSILALRESLLDGDLKNMGVRVVQDESFYVEPKTTKVENRETMAA